jgi:hypothetical protein
VRENVFLGLFVALCLPGVGQSASAQGAIANGGTGKMTHYGMPVGTLFWREVYNNLAPAGKSISQWGNNDIDAQRHIFELQTNGLYELRQAPSPEIRARGFELAFAFAILRQAQQQQCCKVGYALNFG